MDMSWCTHSKMLSLFIIWRESYCALVLFLKKKQQKAKLFSAQVYKNKLIESEEPDIQGLTISSNIGYIKHVCYFVTTKQ